MAVEPTTDGDGEVEGPDPDDGDADGETKTLANSQAEAVVLRDQELREQVDDVLRDLEADARDDPARLPEDRLDALDDAIAELMLFSKDLRDLEGRGDDAA